MIYAILIFIIGWVFTAITFSIIIPGLKPSSRYEGPFPRTVKARKAYGFEIVDAKIIGTRKRWFMTRYVVEYHQHSELFSSNSFDTRYIRYSQIVKN